MSLIVQKFGGATLESSEKILDVAQRIAERRRQGHDLVVVVSAMGKTTDGLLALARKISAKPHLRDVDHLLATGEAMSMALLSMALNEVHCPAIGLNGLQAGIFTDASFSNASIDDIKPERIKEALRQKKVVVVTGFQGATYDGDITTLGRGGSDTTAVALAASLQAARCEILKDVPAIFSADPRIVKNAHPISQLGYDHLLEMTYWGAKVLQYRSVEIAKHYETCLYVGPAHSYGEGTLIKESPMLEDSEILSLNSHELILQIRTPSADLSAALSWFKEILVQDEISYPQVIHSEVHEGRVEIYIAGPMEVLRAILQRMNACAEGTAQELSSVTATCRGSTRPEIMERLIHALSGIGVKAQNLLVSSMSVTVLIEKSARESAILALHALIPTPALAQVAPLKII